MSWEVSCPTFTVLTPWRNSFSAHTRSSLSSWLYSTSRSFGLEVCGEWMGGVEGVWKMGRWYVCVRVGRWRWAEGGTHSRIATPLALFLAMSIINPYPHAITLNSCHSNQPHPNCKTSYCDNLKYCCLLSAILRQMPNYVYCIHVTIMRVTWLDLRSLIRALTDDNLKNCCSCLL